VQPRDFARRGYAVPVMYLVPKTRNRSSIGYDMASDSGAPRGHGSRELMERPIVSGKLQLVRAGHEASRSAS
jgi:CHASE1-domain containing sensor protein